MFPLAKPQHLIRKTAIGFCGSILGGVCKNAPPRSGTLCYLDRVFDWPLEHMEVPTVDLAYAFFYALTELRPGLIMNSSCCKPQSMMI